MERTFLLIVCVLYYYSNVDARYFTLVDSSEVWQSNELEKELEFSSQDVENSNLIEEISLLEEHPIDINKASTEELEKVPGISRLLAYGIVTRRKFKPYASVEELLAIDGMTSELFSFVRKFITIKKRKNRMIYFVSLRSRISTGIEECEGFRDGSYPGSIVKVYNRFCFSLGSEANPFLDIISDCEAGAVTEKDPGETSLTNFSAGYIKFSIMPLAASIVVGDYVAESAEGLVFWRSSAYAKGSDVIIPTRKNGGGISPYLSSDENQFFRGTAATLDFRSAQLQLMYSNKPINASLDSLGRVTSFDQSGLFRTGSELRRKHSARETMIGYRAAIYLLDGFKIGGTGYRAHFDHPLVVGITKEENINETWLHGMDISYTQRNYDVFSECALDRTKSIAIIGGINFAPTKKIALTIVARKYPSEFQSVHGFAFGESEGRVENERGLYSGARVQVTDWITISSYYDQFVFPQPTYSIPTPSFGNDVLVMAECQLTKQFKAVVRFKQKDTPSAIEEPDVYGRITPIVVACLQTNYRLEMEFNSSKTMNLSSRVEWVEVAYRSVMNKERGILLSQSIRWIPFDKMVFNLRIAVFQTDSYDSRMYEFEDNLCGAYSNPALFGRGLRWYGIIQYEPISQISFSAKVAQTVMDGVKSIGSGLDEIPGDSQSLVSVQIDVHL